MWVAAITKLVQDEPDNLPNHDVVAASQISELGVDDETQEDHSRSRDSGISRSYLAGTGCRIRAGRSAWVPGLWAWYQLPRARDAPATRATLPAAAGTRCPIARGPSLLPGGAVVDRRAASPSILGTTASSGAVVGTRIPGDLYARSFYGDGQALCNRGKRMKNEDRYAANDDKSL